jgi:hypothetical protein
MCSQASSDFQSRIFRDRLQGEEEKSESLSRADPIQYEGSDTGLKFFISML